MFNIAAMIILMFVLFGILIISGVVYFAGEEIEILHEMPDIDSSMFRHNISELYTLFPFIFMVLVISVNITLITTDTHDEIWFYMKSNT